MKKILFLLIITLLLSCDNLIEVGGTPYIKEISPMTANIGDTLSIFFSEGELTTEIESLEQIKVCLFLGTKKFIYAPTAYYKNNTQIGNFHSTRQIDSLITLIGEHPIIVQCVVDNSFPTESNVGLKIKQKLITKTLKGNSLILIVKK